MGLASKIASAAGGAVTGQPSAPPYPAAPNTNYTTQSGQQTASAYPAYPPIVGSASAPGQQQGNPQASAQQFNPNSNPQHAHPGQQGAYGGGGAPQQQGGYGAPQQQGAYGAPPQQGAYGAPPQQGAYAAPPQQGTHGGPQKQGGFSETPSAQQGGYGGTAPQQQGAPTPYGASTQQTQQGQNTPAQAYGAAAPAGGHGGGGGNAGVMQTLQNKLQQIITANRLQVFYPPQELQKVMARLGKVDFRALASQWNMPLELATDLTSLALYDIVIYADDSGSMIFEEGGDRINDLKLILGRVAEVATLFDDDGIVVRFMNSAVEGNGIRDAAAATALVQQVQFNGLTPLGTNLDKKVIQPFLAAGVRNRNLQKPILVIVITDGEPAGEPIGATQNVIINAKNMLANSQYGSGAIAFQFAQVGKDQKAQRFLGILDNDQSIGGMVDATSYYELEAEEYGRKGVNLTPELWLVKLMVGAIDPTYDEQDE